MVSLYAGLAVMETMLSVQTGQQHCICLPVALFAPSHALLTQTQVRVAVLPLHTAALETCGHKMHSMHLAFCRLMTDIWCSSGLSTPAAVPHV